MMTKLKCVRKNSNWEPNCNYFTVGLVYQVESGDANLAEVKADDGEMTWVSVNTGFHGYDFEEVQEEVAKIKITDHGGFVELYTVGKVYDAVKYAGGAYLIKAEDGLEDPVGYEGDPVKFEVVQEDPMPVVTPQSVLYDESGSGCGIGFGIPIGEQHFGYDKPTTAELGWLEEAAGEAYDELVGIQALKSESILGEHDGILDDDLFEILNEHADMVNSPSHYGTGSIECIEYIKDLLTKEELIGYLRGNVIKYQHRFRYKNGTEDLKKAEWYLKELIKAYDQ